MEPINEALRLLCQDVKLIDKYIVLHDNKNGKDRMIPLSEFLAFICEEYHKHNVQIETGSNRKRLCWCSQ